MKIDPIPQYILDQECTFWDSLHVSHSKVDFSKTRPHIQNPSDRSADMIIILTSLASRNSAHHFGEPQRWKTLFFMLEHG